MTVWKEPADVATTKDLGAGPVFPAFPHEIDGVTLRVGNRVLVKDQLTATENGYYKVVAGVPPTLMATDDTIEAEDVIRVCQGDRNAHTAWALINATHRLFVRQDVKHYSLKSIDPLKHLWQVLPDATATVASYAEPGDEGGGDFTFIGVPESARVMSAIPVSKPISAVTDVDGLVTITAVAHSLGKPHNLTTTYISGVTGLADKAYSITVVNLDTFTINARISGVSNAAGAKVQYVKLVTAAAHGRVTGQHISVGGVVLSDGAGGIVPLGDAGDIRGVTDLSGVIDDTSISIPIPIATTGGPYTPGSHAVIGDDGLTVPATDPKGSFGGLWQRLRGDHFDVRWFGAKGDWKGLPGKDTDALSSFEACLAAAKAASGNSHVKIVVDGHYYLSNTLHVRQTVTIEGSGNSDETSGVGAQRSGPGTWLIFPTNCDGIQFHHQGEPTGGADYSTIRHLTLWCKEQRAGIPRECPPDGGLMGSGIFINCPVYLDHVTVANFAEHGIWVDSGTTTGVHAGNAGGFQITKCRVGANGKNGIFIRGNDSTVGLVQCCTCSINYGWGYRDETFSGTTYVACHGEFNRGFSKDGVLRSEYSTGNTSNSSVFFGCYAEGPHNELGDNVLIVGGTLSLPQFQLHQDDSQGLSSSIAAGNSISGQPLKFENNSGPEQTLIEFGCRSNIGVNGVVLNFSTPTHTDYNFLRWNNTTGWWNLNNSSPNSRTSIQFPTTRTAPRRIAPLFENGIFFGSASTLNDADTSKALVNHTAASATPPDGTWEKGDVVWNTEATPGGNIGWVCTTAGTNDMLPHVVLTMEKIAKKDTRLTVSAVTDLVLWQYFIIGDEKDTYQIVKITLPTIDITPGARIGFSSGAAIASASGMVVGVQTSKTVNKDDTTVTVNKLDGLVPGQNITIGDEKDTYEIVKITLPTIDITKPGSLCPFSSGAAIAFSQAVFSTFGTVDSPSRSCDASKLLTLADRYVTVTAPGMTMTLPKSPVDGQTHSIKSKAGVTTTVDTEDPGPLVLKLKIDGQTSVTLAPGENGTFRYSAATGIEEWEIR
jgi:hypothetical protein